MAMSRDVGFGTAGGRMGTIWHLKGTARDAVEHPIIPRQPLTTKKYPAPNVNSSKGENPGSE